MKYSLSLIAVLGLFLLPSCASVGAVIDGGNEFTTSVVDGSVKAVSTVSGPVLNDVSSVVETTAESTSGVVETVAKEVDEQTDELQDTPEKKD